MEPVKVKCLCDGMATIVFPLPVPLSTVETRRETIKGETVNCFIGE